MRLDLSALPVPAVVPVVPISQNHGWEQTGEAETLATQGFAESVPVVPMQKQQMGTSREMEHAAAVVVANDTNPAPPAIPTARRQDGPRPVAELTPAIATAAALKHPLLDRSLTPTHRTTAPLLFHQPGRGPFLIGTGELVHVFPSLFAAKAAGLPAEVWQELGAWAAQKNTEKGYRLAWIEGDVRGIHPDHLEPLP